MTRTNRGSWRRLSDIKDILTKLRKTPRKLVAEAQQIEYEHDDEHDSPTWTQKKRPRQSRLCAAKEIGGAAEKKRMTTPSWNQSDDRYQGRFSSVFIHSDDAPAIRPDAGKRSLHCVWPRALPCSRHQRQQLVRPGWRLLRATPHHLHHAAGFCTYPSHGLRQMSA